MSSETLPSRKTVRLPAYDYASYGAYFVTLVTADRACILGDITEEEIQASPVGSIVLEEWQRTAELRQNIELDEFVVMPNHFHALVWITGDPSQQRTGALQHAPTKTFTPPGSGSLSATIFNAFKGTVTRRARTELRIDHAYGSADFTSMLCGTRKRFRLSASTSSTIRRVRADDEEHPANWR